MRVINNPARLQWTTLCQRPSIESDFLEGAVRNTLQRVRNSGDRAILDLTDQFDKIKLNSLTVIDTEYDEALKSIPKSLANAIDLAIKNVRAFHERQTDPGYEIETMPGVKCWRRSKPIEKVGIYIPGGTAPLFSTLIMLGVPAKIAGCSKIVICTPPDQNGKIPAPILYVAKVLSLDCVFKAGGAQAIAAMAYGTETIPAVNKIFGPGNQYVTKAKQLVSMDGVAIDLPAGPSEVLVLVDENANPDFVAADLLAQAEHGPDSQVILVASNLEIVENVNRAIEAQLKELPRAETATKALANSLAVTFDNRNDQIDFINEYAPEHLIINTSDSIDIADRVANAGSIFLGAYTPESVGDYASGTNHTLPTSGYAKAYSGVSLSSFQKFITYQEITRKGLELIGPAVERLAEAESLEAHKRSVTIRLGK
ncbi:MAG: histidinol dehydrogenase [Cyclobacteriaceae bacterium]|nr:histidinol dehydrogenase [Cyclobacteriaceae bacterium]